MADTENDPLEQQAIDPPEGQGGGTAQAVSMDASGSQLQPIDPPEGQGGGT